MSINLKRKLSAEDTSIHYNKKITAINENMEEKISRLVNAVITSQRLGQLVIIVRDEDHSPYVTLQNALSTLDFNLTVSKSICNDDIFYLAIDGDEFAKDTFQNMQIAKKSLAVETLEKLKDICFFIEKKSGFVNVTKENLQAPASSSTTVPSVNTNSIAHKIMLKMGWAGGGLGVQEQGNLDSVMLHENVNRQGLGTKNLMKEITKKLENFTKSSNVLTLVFNSDFTKEERALIHKAARKFNLKSKSSGGECNRVMTVSRKITRIDIVRELLRVGGEDGLYKLHIPRNFAHLWTRPEDE